MSSPPNPHRIARVQVWPLIVISVQVSHYLAKEEAMGIDESLVKEIVRQILAKAAPERIILFGSAATGDMTRDSATCSL